MLKLTDFIKIHSLVGSAEQGAGTPETKKPTEEQTPKTTIDELNGLPLPDKEKEKLQSLNIEIGDVRKEINNKTAGLEVLGLRKDILERGINEKVTPEELQNDPEAIKMVDDIYELKRTLFALEEEKAQLFRSVEVGRANELTPNEIDTMKKIDNKEFLKYPAEQRLRFVTKGNINSETVSDKEGGIKNLEFTFTYGDKFNKELYIMTTAGQVLPKNVRSINSFGVEYTRKGLNGEFFSETGKRFLIHEGTQLEVTKFGNEEELKALEENIAKEIAEFKDSPYYNLALESKKKGYDPKFIVGAFSDKLTGNKETEAVEIEQLLTDIAREEDSFNENYPGVETSQNNGKISEKFAGYLLNAFGAKEETISQIAKDYNFDPKILKETKANNEKWGGSIKSMEQINIDGVSKEEINRVLSLKRFTPGSKETQILFSVALQAAGLPEEWYNSEALHYILGKESNGKVGVLNYTINGMSTEQFKQRALSMPNHKNPIGAKSTASGLGQLLLSNVDKYYPDGRKGIGDPLNEAVGFIRYIVDRYGTPEITKSVYGKVGTYNHPTKGPQKKGFKEGY